MDAAEQTDLGTGTMVDHFKVVRLVGRGGMGEVYLARDTKLGRKVALKLVHPRALGNEQAVERFLYEARTTAKFSHPHIVAIHFVGEHEGRPYVALEYLEGQDLRQRLEERRPGLDESLKIGLAIAEALEEAHRHGVLHRDLKPENVLVPADGRLRVVDFGLAKAIQGEQVQGTADTADLSCIEQQPTEDEEVLAFQTKGGLKGTPLYMAPEQWGEEEVTSAADVWALGLIFYELLSGSHPYADLTVGALCARVYGPEPVPPLEPEEPIAEALLQLVTRCLDKAPESRPSASQVAQELNQLLRRADTQIAAEQGLLRGMAEREDLRKLCTTLPLPLAELLRRSLNGKSAVEQHHCAFFLAEATLKLAAAARIGLYVDAALKPGSKLSTKLEGLAFCSLGHWVGLLRDVNDALGSLPDAEQLPLARNAREMSAKRPSWSAVQQFASRAADAGAVSSETMKQALRRGAVGFFEVVAAYRNEVMGHGSIRSNSFYDSCGSALLEACTEVLSLKALFGALRLSSPRRSDAGRPHWHLLSGLSGTATDRLAPDAVPGHLYMHGDDGTVCLHPIVVATEDEFGREQVGFLNRTIRRTRATSSASVEEIRRVDYLDYASGESLRGVDAREAVAAFLSQLRDARVAVEELDGIADATRAASPEEESTDVVADGEILGDFELLGELGRGGMGIVYRARQLSMNRLVALKVLALDLAAEETALKRFRGEIAALARCDHPNVVKVLTSGHDGSRHYYAMEYVDGADLAKTYLALESWDTNGSSLRESHLPLAVSSGATRNESHDDVDSERLEDGEAQDGEGHPPEAPGQTADSSHRSGRPELERVAPPTAGTGRVIHVRLAELFADAAAGLAHLHHNGVVHRDIKPGNLMLTADASRIVIMDLGLALLEDRSRALTATDVKILGTLMYMAPEQLQRRLLDVDARADIYSLGATLYELVTRRRFFDGDTEARLIQQVLHETPPPPRQVDEQVPRDLATIVEKATAKLPEQRYASVRDLEDDLRAFARGDPIKARPPGVPRRTLRWVARHGALVAVFLLVLVVAGGAGGWLWWTAEHAEWCAAVGYRWSAPECVGPISSSRQQGREASYRLTSVKGRAVRVELLNGLGFPRNDEDGFARWEYTYRDSGKLASVVIHNAVGQVVRKELYSDDLKRVELRDAQDRPLKLADSEDISVLSRTYGADGRVEVELYRNVFGAPRGNSLGYYGRRFEHSSLGLVSRWTHLGQDDKPTSGNRAAVSVRHGYDAQATLTDISWYGHDDKPVLNHEGFARVTMKHDERGNSTEQKYFGVDGQPVLNKSRCAQLTRTYDERGNQTEETYSGVNGKPVLHLYGFARATIKHDRRGNITDQQFFGLDDKPVISKFGFARMTSKYDERRMQAEIAYFGVDGKPLLNKAGFARVTVEHDERGHATDQRFFGVDGQPVLIAPGYARATAKYDERGNNTEWAYFGVDDEPVLQKFGYARRIRQFDDRGNLTEEVFRGVDGKPVLTRGGFARVSLKYDERGNLTERACFGVEGEPVPTENGDARRTNKYDDRGNKTEVAYFGADGKPVLSKFGVARVHMKYDAAGNQTEEACFGADGKPVLTKFGFARATMKYDAAGNNVERRYFGVNGDPALKGGFAARRACEYSSSAEIQRCEYFDAADESVGVLVPDYTAARSVAKRLGAVREAFSEALTGGAGAVVLGVPDRGPMHAVGLKPGDVVARCDGAPVEKLEDLAVCATGTAQPEVELLVIRDDQESRPRMPAAYPALLFLEE